MTKIQQNIIYFGWKFIILLSYRQHFHEVRKFFLPRNILDFYDTDLPFMVYTHLLRHKFTFYGKDICVPLHTSAFYDKHNHFLWHKLSFLAYITFYCSNSTYRGYAPLLGKIFVSCLSADTFDLKWHNINKSSIALIIAKHESIIACTSNTHNNGSKQLYSR